MLAWDTETCPIRRAMKAPPLVCVSWAREEDECGLVHRMDALPWLHRVFDSGEPMVLMNAPYDLAVVGNAFPELMPKIFEALAEDRVYDVGIRQKLYDIAFGEYAGGEGQKKGFSFIGEDDGKKHKVNYSLSTIHHRLCGKPLEKDIWRMLYAKYIDVPLEEWPAGAKQYPLDDALSTLRVFRAQEALELSEEVFEDQHRQARAHWALHLMQCWGVRTAEKAIEKLDERLKKEYKAALLEIKKGGLIRRTGAKNMKKIKRLMYEALGDLCALTEKGEEIAKELVKEQGLDLDDAEQVLRRAHEHKYVSTNAEMCALAADAGNPILKHYHTYVHAEKLRSTYVSSFWAGIYFPIQANFEVLLETGRTSCWGPNLQNLPREPGLRECFIARKGRVLVAVDYDLAELRSLAQVCLEMVGYSEMADAINRGIDVHLQMAANILGIPYEEAAARRKAEDPEMEMYRTLAKAANFGFPGGLGAATFCKFAKGTYNVNITEEQARELKQQWLDTWPEMREYFRLVDGLLGRNEGTIVQLYSNRVRGDCSYTQACNTLFQGLTADAAKEALWEITRRQFCEPESVLYGTHLVVFVHDENIVECPEEIAHEVAMEMIEIMVEVYNRWTPDIPMTCEAAVMRSWSKKAKPRWRDGGKKRASANDRMIPFEDWKKAA